MTCTTKQTVIQAGEPSKVLRPCLVRCSMFVGVLNNSIPSGLVVLPSYYHQESLSSNAKVGFDYFPSIAPDDNVTIINYNTQKNKIERFK